MAMLAWRWPGHAQVDDVDSLVGEHGLPVGRHRLPAEGGRGALERRAIASDEHVLPDPGDVGVEGADVAPGVGVGLAHEGVADDGDAVGAGHVRLLRWARPSAASASGELASGRQIEAARGDDVVVGREALDVERAVVADLVERGQQVLPVDLVTAGRASVVAAHLDVDQVTAGRAYGVGARPLLDVEVVGVQRQPERVAQQAVEPGQRLLDGVDQRRLVAVERLDPDRDPGGRGVVDHGREVAAPLGVGLPALGVVHPPDPAGLGVERAAHARRPDAGGEVDARSEGSPAWPRPRPHARPPGCGRAPWRRRRTAPARCRRARPGPRGR